MGRFVSFISLSILISIFSCYPEPLMEESESQSSILFEDVDERLWVHFTNFEEEAAIRGLNFDLNELGITGVIENIPEDGVAGTCQYGQHIHHVTIDNNYWNRASFLQREFVVFHELGHCVLFRDHEEGQFTNGICRSIMRSGLGNCRDAYIQANREYYIDELFDQS